MNAATDQQPAGKGELVTGRAIASITAMRVTEKAVGLKHHGLDQRLIRLRICERLTRGQRTPPEGALRPTSQRAVSIIPGPLLDMFGLPEPTPVYTQGAGCQTWAPAHSRVGADSLKGPFVRSTECFFPFWNAPAMHSHCRDMSPEIYAILEW